MNSKSTFQMLVRDPHRILTASGTTLKHYKSSMSPRTMADEIIPRHSSWVSLIRLTTVLSQEQQAIKAHLLSRGSASSLGGNKPP